MLKAPRKHFILLLIFAFSFIYRMLLMFWNNFPPGADIGLHNSVIYSITGSGSTNFLHNAFQFGGGTSLTFPGYHIFASSMMLMTGLPEYVAQAAIVALFSSLIVLCTFLITKIAWSERAAFIVSFLAAISRFDIEMTLWGGYPNVITLMLIPLTFYFYLQKDRFSIAPFLVSTSILAGSIFLTHSLSAAIFVGVTFITVLCIFVAPKTFRTPRKTVLYWILPIVLGVILVLPFLLNAIPTYLSDNSSAPGVQGVSDITSAILSTRILPLEMVLPLFLIVLAFAFFSKKFNGRFLSLPTLLLSMWLVVPLFLTQGYLFGFIIDYNRFLYFIILPVIVFIAVLIDHGAEFFTSTIYTYRLLTRQLRKVEKNTNKKIAWLLAHLTNKTIYAGFLLFFLLFSFVFIPVLMTPFQNVGETIQSFYQVMNNPGWESINWIRQNTPNDSVFVSDALFGWWLAGFAQRPTLSAVDPQYLTSARELTPAKNAGNLLDTDYLIDNDLVQVREDGGYLARHNPEILADLNWTYFPYSFFNFESDQTRIYYEVAGEANGTLQWVSLDQLAVEKMQMENDSQHATITVVKGNDFLNYTQVTTVYKGLRFVNLTSTVDTSFPGVSLELVDISVQSKGTQIPYNDDNTIGMLDEGVKTFGQIIFTTKPSIQKIVPGSPTMINLEYRLNGESQGKIEISASAYSADNDPAIYSNEARKDLFFGSVMTANLEPQTPDYTKEWRQVFNYQLSMQYYDVSYIACRVPEMYPKFLKDPSFSLVFINSEIAIFKVKG
jgi:hypothetical protein